MGGRGGEGCGGWIGVVVGWCLGKMKKWKDEWCDVCEWMAFDVIMLVLNVSGVWSLDMARYTTAARAKLRRRL